VLAQRIVTALLLVSAAVASVLLLPTHWVAPVLALLWLGGAWEWAAFGGWKGSARVGYAFTVGLLMLLTYWLAFDVRWLLYTAAGWWLIAFVWILRFPTTIPDRLVAVIGAFVLVPSWFALVYLHGQGNGPVLVLTVLGVVSAADVGAYFAGRQWGRHKLAPNVSPKKTWEGAVGGLIAASWVAGVAAWLLDLPLAGLVLVGAVSAVVSIIGDLSVSMFKRNAGIKDSGNLLPGHGGVMDRIDSLSAAAPCFCLAIIAMGPISPS
jgi:phosphatidate cytidylyltransferase